MPLDLNLEWNLIRRKRQREDDEPVEKEPRLYLKADEFTSKDWFNDVLRNAEHSNIAKNLSIKSHIIVCDIDNNKIDIWNRNEISTLLEAHAQLSFCLEALSYSSTGEVFELKNLSKGAIMGGLLGSKLLFMYKNSSNYVELLEKHKHDRNNVWKMLVNLSKKEESYMNR